MGDDLARRLVQTNLTYSLHQSMVCGEKFGSVSSCSQHNNFPFAFQSPIDEAESRNAASQLGQLSLQKFLKVSASRAKDAMSDTRRTDVWSCKVAANTSNAFNLAARGSRPVSRSQQGLTTKESWDLRASCDAVVLATSTARKRAANIKLPCSASTAVGPAVRQRSAILGSHAYPRANQKATAHQASALSSCNLHTYLHRPPTSPSAISQLRSPATAAVLPDNHCWRLSSDSLPLPNDVHTPDQPPKQFLGFVQTAGKAPVKADANLTSTALCPQHQLGQMLQPEQPSHPVAKLTTGNLLPKSPTPVQPELLSLSASTALTALPVDEHKHRSLQQPVDPGFETDDDQALDCSSSSSSSGDSAHDACLPTSIHGQDMDDCFSGDTSQALTDASSSIGDAELTGSLLANPASARPLMTPSLMGMAPTVAFVGTGPEAGAESSLTPLR